MQFLDIDLKGLLGGKLAQILAPKPRGISSHTDQPEACILALHKHPNDNQVCNTAISTFVAANNFGRVPEDTVTAINKIDRTIAQGMLLAEARCGEKTRPAWSAALTAASRTVKFWKTLVSGLATKANITPILQQIGAFLRWEIMPLDSNLTDAKVALKAALKSLRQCREKAKELRKSFLDDQIEAAALAEDTTTKKMLKKMRHREAQSACYKKLANALKPAGHRGGVTKVELKVDNHTVAYAE